MTVQGLDQLISNLSALSKTAVPRATSQAVNRVAGRAISRSASQVSKSTRVPLKLVRGRTRLKKASPSRPIATIRVKRGDLPVINLGPVRLQISRRNGKGGADSVLKVGRFSFPGGFVQQLSNGRWQVMRRTSKARYPIEVIKIPMAAPLTQAFHNQTKSLLMSDMPKELAAALSNQLRLVIKR
ncbi:phage tail protein [Yersinia massiliensis]|uniref:phage tail protein n=1 Tax=Yersinia TaxID=629 RepID=UPI002240776E|nr:phage tail protein [Yersinia massiliensis]MDA5547642.1 phage tail protein [Yersinia massiliensis]UZM78043.1 phage tail protein [Yersinia massiliensis]